MSYKVFMPTEKPILTFAVDEELLERLNDFRFENRIETRSEAIRMLVEKALKDYEKKKSKG
jgi:metal-responsive CopG/Arc/MetJ family transcriptional regulator